MKRTFITALAAMMLCTTAQAETTNTNADKYTNPNADRSTASGCD